MSLMAGAVTTRPGAVIPEALRADLERLVSRNAEDRRSVSRHDWCHLVKVDIGAHGAAGERVDGTGRVTLVTGDPALHAGSGWAGTDRLKDVELLHEAGRQGRFGAGLAAAMGTFSAAHLDPQGRRLFLATDKCGMRPLYFWAGQDYIVFASALRVLERLPQVPRRMDEVAVAQRITWTYILGDRTPYEGIRMLLPGELLECGPAGLRRSPYWRWHDVRSPASTEAEHEALWYERLSAGIARRRGTDRRVVSYLTGGMDSRTVVCELLRQGAAVDTINGSYPGELDQVLAQQFAAAAGTNHLDIPSSVGDPRYPLWIAGEWFARLARGGPRPDRPALIWAGVGGSVGVGHQHVTDGLVAAARTGNQRHAIEFYLEQEGLALPLRLLRRGRRDELYEAVRDGFIAELDRVPFEDPARSFHVAMVLNDTRRAFATNLEELDLHRLDSVVPLADAHLLEAIFAAPMELCLWHRLYMGMIAPLRDSYELVGWQTYAGHLPSPLPVPADAPHQRSREQLALRKELARPAALRKGWRALVSHAFPSGTVSRWSLATALALYALRIRDTGYHLEAAAVFDAVTRPPVDRSAI